MLHWKIQSNRKDNMQKGKRNKKEKIKTKQKTQTTQKKQTQRATHIPQSKHEFVCSEFHPLA